MYKKIKEITRSFSAEMCAVKDKQGKVLTEGGQVKARLKEYTEQLDKRDPAMPEKFEENRCDNESLILQSKVKQAIREVAKNKSLGIDEMPIKLIQSLGVDGISILTALCQEIWNKCEWPQDWKRSVYIPIPKKGDTRECTNRRTISLISHISRIMFKIIQKRLEPYMEQELSTTQAGFRKGRWTRDQIANLRWIMETAIEYQQLYICFIDYSKVFNCVDHDLLWNIMTDRFSGTHCHTTKQAVQTTRSHNENRVKRHGLVCHWKRCLPELHIVTLSV